MCAPGAHFQLGYRYIIARRNFEACVKFNRGLAIEMVIGTVDVMSVRANVNVALVKLAMGGGGFGE